MSSSFPQPATRSDIPAFIVMDVMAAAARRTAEGGEVLHMEVGEPGTPPARIVRDAVRVALDAGPIGYTAALGMPALRQRIAASYREQHGIAVDPERVIITMGSSAGFILAFLSAFDHGDRIAVQTPGYPAYRNTTAALGLEPVILETTAATQWAPTVEMVEKAHAEKPLRGLLVASPNNPTGTIISLQRMAELAACCRRLGIWFISDEIYHGLTYGEAGTTGLSVDDEAIVINSFSKYYCMTGWRVGWMVVPERLVRPIERLTQNLFISAPTLSQVAALAAFDATTELDGYKAAYARNRLVLQAELPKIGFEEVLPMDGGFFAYANIRRFANDSGEFARRMLAETGVAATPGLDFDPARGHQYIRFSYAGAPQTIDDAMARLKAWLA